VHDGPESCFAEAPVEVMLQLLPKKYRHTVEARAQIGLDSGVFLRRHLLWQSAHVHHRSCGGRCRAGLHEQRSVVPLEGISAVCSVGGFAGLAHAHA